MWARFDRWRACVLVDYGPDWPGLFEREAARIRAALGERLPAWPTHGHSPRPCEGPGLETLELQREVIARPTARIREDEQHGLAAVVFERQLATAHPR